MLRATVRWKLLAWLLGPWIFLSGANAASAAQPSASRDIPPELRPWIEWAKHREPAPGNCRNVDDVDICVWQRNVRLDVNAQGGRFELDVRVEGSRRIVLPGDSDHWPQQLEVDGRPAVVEVREERPAVRVGPGSHRIRGRWQWPRMPSQLRIPPTVASIELRVDDRTVPFVVRSDDQITLPESSRGPEPGVESTGPDTLRIDVARRIIDGVPLKVHTRIDLGVSGSAREIALPNPLPTGARPLRIESPLPIRRSAAGELRIDAVAGRHHIEVHAVISDVPQTVVPQTPQTLAPPRHPSPWPAREYWLWSPAPADEASLGRVELGHAAPVDRSRTTIPESWSGDAAYVVTPDRGLEIRRIRRSRSAPAANDLRLKRELRAEFSGAGWFVRDTLQGTLPRATRIELEAGKLEHASADGESLVITRSPAGQDGLEIRHSAVDITANWHLDRAMSAPLPLAGWTEPAERLEVDLHLPRGWSILHARGPGVELRGDWWGAWRAVDFVSLLIACVLIGRAAGIGTALVAGVGLTLAHPSAPAGYPLLAGTLAMLAGLTLLQRRWPVGHPASSVVQTSWWVVAAIVLVFWTLRAPAAIDGVWRAGHSLLVTVDFADGLAASAGMVAMLATLLLVIYGSLRLVAHLAGRSATPAKSKRTWTWWVIAGVAVVPLVLVLLALPRNHSKSYEVADAAAQLADEAEAGGSGIRHLARKARKKRPRQISSEMAFEPEEPEPAYASLHRGSEGRMGAKRRVHSVLPEPEPSAAPQAGRAHPHWRGTHYAFVVPRRLTSADELELWLLSPTWARVWTIVQWFALAIAGLTLFVRGRVRSGSSNPKRATSGTTPAAAVTGLAIIGTLVATPAYAQSTPPPELLQELAERLDQTPPDSPSPPCDPHCTLVQRLHLQVQGQILDARAEVHMAGPGVYRLPGSFASWAPRAIRVDGRPAEAFTGHEGGVILRLPAGLHRVDLRGPIAGPTLALELGDAPRRVTYESRDWRIDGIDDHGRADQLQLQRRAVPTTASNAPGQGRRSRVTDERPEDGQLPTWLTLERRITIDTRWTVATTVTRSSAGPRSLRHEVSLLPGERLLESSANVDDPFASVTLATEGDQATWTSVIDPSESLELRAPADAPWTESWIIECGEAWQCEYEGLMATTTLDGRTRFHPWPGESLTVKLRQPPAAPGEHLAIDAASLRLTVHDGRSEGRLQLHARATTPQTRELQLPEGAIVRSLTMDGRPLAHDVDATNLRLPLQPGEHELEADFELPRGTTEILRTPNLGLGGSATNLELRVDLAPDDRRVVVWAQGFGEGPRPQHAWLAWLSGLALISYLLARVTTLPVRGWQWFLLGLGLPAKLAPWILGLFFAFSARRERGASIDDPHRFNCMQIVLGLTGVVALLAFGVSAFGVLANPEQAAPHLTRQSLHWYVDHTTDGLPGTTIVSIPGSLWTTLVMAWIGAVAWQSVAWIRWAHASWTRGGTWRSSPTPRHAATSAHELARSSVDPGPDR